MYKDIPRKNKQKQNPYLVQKVMSASPEQLISYIFEAGATACTKQDRVKASKAVQALINSLNFDYKEISLTFYNVYRYLGNLISKGKFEEAKQIFTDLKATWAKAMKVI